MALTVQGSGDGVEAKQDDDDDIGDHVGQHLEPEEGVDLWIYDCINKQPGVSVHHLLADMMQVAVDAPEDVQLDHHSGLLVSGDLSLVALET